MSGSIRAVLATIPASHPDESAFLTPNEESGSINEPASPERINNLKLDQYLRFELKSKSVKDSVEFLSETLSISKKLLYDRALTIINQQEH